MRAMRISLGGCSRAGRAAIRRTASVMTDSATAWVVSTMGTPASPSTGFCRKLSMETPASARVSDTEAANRLAIQTNNVEVDDRGYIYIVDRANTGMHILELAGAARRVANLP